MVDCKEIAITLIDAAFWYYFKKPYSVYPKGMEFTALLWEEVMAVKHFEALGLLRIHDTDIRNGAIKFSFKNFEEEE